VTARKKTDLEGNKQRGLGWQSGEGRYLMIALKVGRATGCRRFMK